MELKLRHQMFVSFIIQAAWSLVAADHLLESW